MFHLIFTFLAFLCVAQPAFAQEESVPLPEIEISDSNEKKSLLPFLDEQDEEEKIVMEEMNTVVVKALDKITGRTESFDVAIDETVKFGSIYVKPKACRKNPPIEPPESAAFVQIWQVDPDEGPEWIFSNWMFASSPALSAMEHPVYDIWVLDCKNAVTTENKEAESSAE